MTERHYSEIKKRYLLSTVGAYDMQEKWIPTGSNVCPICRFLGGLGWVKLGALPAFDTAHSTLGGPNWKASDLSCLCTKDYRRGVGGSTLTLQETTELWYITYQNLSSHDKQNFKCSCHQ